MQRSPAPLPSPSTTAGTILVVGAHGAIGSALVPALVAAGERVRAASRRGRSPLHGVEAVRLDLADARTIAPALDGVDRMFLVNPAENLDVTGALFSVVDAATERGVKVVLLSVHGAADDEANPYRQVERRLKAAGARSTFLRPNWFADNFHTYWADDVARGVLALPAGTGRISFVDVRDVAGAALAALRSDRFDGCAFELTGPAALDLHQATALIAARSGRPLRYQPIDESDYVSASVGAGVPEAFARMLAGLFAMVREGGTASVCDGMQTLTGRSPRSLADYAGDRFSAAAAAREKVA